MKHSLLYAAGLCFAILGCKQAASPSNEKDQQINRSDYKAVPEERNLSAADTIMNGNGSSTSAAENTKDTEHKFIRTANVRFKVKNVETATYKIEDITSRHGGFVTFTHLNSSIDNVSTTAISADSSLETTNFTVTNTITLRVPNTKMDTTLKDIALLIDYLDYRIIKADDVSLQIQSNNLARKRGAKNAERLARAIDNRGRKLTEIVDAEASLSEKDAQADDALLTNLNLDDQIKFSTIQLAVYQRQAIKSDLISNDKNIDAYEPGFGSKVLNSLKYGLDMLLAVFVALIKMWVLFLLAIIGWLAYKKHGKKARIGN